MIGYRRRGFTDFYTMFIGLVGVTLLLGYAEISEWVPWIGLLEYINLGPYILAVAVGFLFGSRLVRREAHRLHALPFGVTASLALKQTALIAACVFTLMFVTKDRAISRLFLGSYLGLLGCILMLLHGWIPRFFAKMLFADNARMRTLLVGSETGPDELLPWVKSREHLGIQIVGYLADRTRGGDVLPDVPFLGATQQMEAVLKERHINQVILLDWLDDPEEMERLLEICEAEGCRFLIHNSFATRFARNLIGMEEGGQSFFTVQEEPLEDPVNRAVKRAMDILISLPVVLLVLPPLTILVWLGQMWQAPGPLFFTRARGGKQRREFAMLKYRSMYLKEFDVTKQATTSDERIYPLGRFLRKTSLDEFPQFINVLLGEMSLVGPRPHLLEHDTEFSEIDPTYRMRSLIKPGITGLAQVRGFRGGITDPDKLKQRVYWDLSYLTNWSIGMDLRIIFLTVWQMIFPHKTAY